MPDQLERCHNCQEPARRRVINRIPDHIHEAASKLKVVGGKCTVCGEKVGNALEHTVTRHFRHVAWDKIQYEDHDGPCGLPCEETLSAGEKKLRGPGRTHDGSTCPCMEPARIEARRKRDEAEEKRKRGGSA